MSITESDLERMIHDESLAPTAFPFSLLAEITDGFSEEIGRGGFAVVYKATLEKGDIAVKKLSSNAYMFENEFHREIECLMKARHKNIVRFLGYCVDTQGTVASDNGKFVMASLEQRLLCFEYLPKGSLHDYIEDASGGLEWTDRYKIIKGICEGLCYLHQNNILHLDLKPANILLDENMQPKITDFGLSRCFDEEQTEATTTNVMGTMGYLPPEFTSRKITHKFDLYSLGVIIMEILTGEKGYQDIEDVLENWSNRLQKLEGSPEWEQIKVCAEIGMECTEYNPAKRPCSMKHIMDRLVETEGDEVIIPPTEPAAGPMELLGVHPLELCFYDKLIPCSLYLTNNTNELVAFRLHMDDGDDSYGSFISLPLHGIVPPRSTYTLVVKMKYESKERNELFLESSMLVLGDKHMINTFQCQPKEFLEKVKDTGTNVVQVARLKAACTPPPAAIITSSSKIVISTGPSSDTFYSLDTNHGRQWIITGQSLGHVRIWNNQTQKLLSSLRVSTAPVTCIKFIARKQWFVIGTHDGLIHVYNCDTKMQKITTFSSYRSDVYSLAVHPTKPFLLSSHYQEMVLWDWDKGWKCAETFEKEHSGIIRQAVFNSKETIASASSDNKVKVWTLNSPKSSYTFLGHSREVNCLDFFMCYDQEYLITGCDDQTAKIWDMQKKKCVCTLEASISPITAVLYEPKLQILITGSDDGCIYLWRATNSRINSRSLRLERIFKICSGQAVFNLAYLMGRVVIGQRDGVAIMNIDNNVNNLEESTDDSSETLSHNYATRPAIDTTCKVMSSSSQLLDVALELICPCEPNESISWLVHLTNSTDENVAYVLGRRSGINKHWDEEVLYGIVLSRSIHTLIVSTNKEELHRAQTELDLILQSSALRDTYAVLFKDYYDCIEFFKDAKEMENDVHEVAVLLKANYHAAQLGESTQSKLAVIPRRIKIISTKITDKELCSIDAHPTERWIITGHAHGYVSTWNQQTQGPMDAFKVSERSVTGIKVIARKQWIAAMTEDGCIYVYNCARVTKMEKMASFRDGAVGAESLAVHPIQPYVWSTSGRLWDWDNGWKEAQHKLYAYSIRQVAFNPKDSSCACAAEKVVKVWSSLDSGESDYTLSGHFGKVCCLSFFTRDDRQHLITGSDDCTAKIWDLQTRECIHTMEAIMSPVSCVISLPDFPYLVTGSEYGMVQLWGSTDFRLLRTLKVSAGGPVRGIACLMGSPRVVIGQKHAITIMEIDDEEFNC